MKDLKFLVFVFFCIALIHCDDTPASSGSAGGTTTSTPPSTSATDKAISLAQAASKGQTLDMAALNTQLKSTGENQEEWTTSPLLILAKVLEKNWDAKNQTIRLESKSGESFDNLDAIITYDNDLNDENWDKVQLSKLSKSNGAWQIEKVINVNNAVLQDDVEKVDIEAVEQKGQTMSFSDFNQEVVLAMAQKAAWVNSPLLLALKFVGADMETRKKSISVEKLDAANQVRVTIQDDGYLDDSIRGGIVILRMAKSDQLWQIKKASQAWNCWQGRGHEDFSTEPCN